MPTTDGTCGTAPTPRAADVVFEADASSKPYCMALGAFNTEVEKISDSRFDPDVMRKLVTGARFAEVLDGLDGPLPPRSLTDVQADTEWFRTRWSDVVAEYDHDIRNIYLDGTPEDLPCSTARHPDVARTHISDTAYEEQVCEAG